MDPYRFIGYIRTFGRLTLIWPPDSKVSRCQFVYNHIMWLNIIVANCLAIMFMTVYIVKKKNDPVAVSNTLTLNVVAIDCFLQMIIVRSQWPRFQILIHEITEFVRCAEMKEKIVFQKYIKRYSGYQFIVGLATIAVILMYWCEPVSKGKTFPVDAWYPFSTDPLGTRIAVNILQYFMIITPVTYLSHDAMVAMVLWYATARFELLAEEFRKMRTPVQFCECIQKHKKLLRFVKETERAISWVILKTLGLAIIVIVATTLLWSHYSAFLSLSQSVLTTMATAARVFGSAWAVDDLTDMAENISWAIYQPSIIGKPSNLGKSMSFVIQMSQRSMAFNLGGIGLKLSLRLFTQYVLKVFSFYMTMRVVVDRYI